MTEGKKAYTEGMTSAVCVPVKKQVICVFLFQDTSVFLIIISPNKLLTTLFRCRVLLSTIKCNNQHLKPELRHFEGKVYEHETNFLGVNYLGILFSRHLKHPIMCQALKEPMESKTQSHVTKSSSLEGSHLAHKTKINVMPVMSSISTLKKMSKVSGTSH